MKTKFSIIFLLLSITIIYGQNCNKIKSIAEIFNCKEYYNYSIEKKIIVNINNDNFKDVVLILKNKFKKYKETDRYLIFLIKQNESYKISLSSKNILPCLECGNKADSFSDFSVNNKKISFYSSYLNSNDGKKRGYFFISKKGKFYLKKITVEKIVIGNNKSEIKTYSEKNFGKVMLKDFNFNDYKY